jgi:ribosome-binding factor A
MAKIRTARVEGMIMEDISKLLVNKIRDPRLASVTLTKVKVTPDLRRATIYYSLFNVEGREDAGKSLKGSTAFFRREIGRTLKLQYVPEIHFLYDDSLEYSQHMDEIFEKLSKEKKADENGL